jgi:hypothetical protein
MPLEKEEALLSLLDFMRLDDRGWETVDHWDADLCAIGIRAKGRDDRLVYMSTFGEKPGEYYYECEVANNASNLGYDVVDKGQHVRINALITALERHLQIE